jgi:serine/threonine protein kinase
MFHREDPASSLKMIDLGLSEHYKDGEQLVGPATGTLAYMSPEMIKGQPYDRQCDIWSLGVILFAMLMGEPLFTHDDDTKCEQQILDPKHLRRELRVRLNFTKLVSKTQRFRLDCRSETRESNVNMNY